ncbi:hypothetical protein CC85DRAFT_149462 [Cutaneotrichosporon oleaginosum]|uniref:Uncharacterized protein n=1 Tax=Cutaneotrichosporon oleaginosum TaxID=879819 RepID=A0A0J0XHA4_9TREE|nr:uncharacterized protein CC85DRAFT_149462 [Cutaneotrichosporon oleaginosum]KLT40448.1 hypothetical protein CC85DRAFT_149462 [Cutaneotrichosporon oleaginosum]TXT15359.1 hypothetical protein COLE_01552 [Cutaneotrichosporon oleaginosum]
MLPRWRLGWIVVVPSAVRDGEESEVRGGVEASREAPSIAGQCGSPKQQRGNVMMRRTEVRDEGCTAHVLVARIRQDTPRSMLIDKILQLVVKRYVVRRRAVRPKSCGDQEQPDEVTLCLRDMARSQLLRLLQLAQYLWTVV